MALSFENLPLSKAIFMLLVFSLVIPSVHAGLFDDLIGGLGNFISGVVDNFFEIGRASCRERV